MVQKKQKKRKRGREREKQEVRTIGWTITIIYEKLSIMSMCFLSALKMNIETTNDTNQRRKQK